MIRRVVTGHREGKAVVVGDGKPPRSHAYTNIPGMQWSFAWATLAQPHITAEAEAEAVSSETTLIPPLGQTRLLFLQVPPDAWAMRKDFDPAAAVAEMMEQQPDMAATFEGGAPGFHRTDSIDYVIVLDGEIVLELDDQQEVLLKEHDVLVQAGTRHAWRNRSDRTATIAVVLVGAERDTN